MEQFDFVKTPDLFHDVFGHGALRSDRDLCVREQLQCYTNWELVPAPEAVDDATFFALLAERKFRPSRGCGQWSSSTL